ncbi:MAG TPA: CHAD domain-containing protein, partial [Nevskiaceae bacterium]|nr:CHAD domain-containing protein [Nevskiaceae bacterium]
RAALRLLRPRLGERRYRAENLALRDAGRRLAPLRNAKALLEAYQDFCRRQAKQIAALPLGPLQQQLRAQLARTRRAQHGHADATGAAARDLRAVCLRMQGLRLRSLPSLVPALHQLYRKCRRAMHRARKANTAQALHEWRKQVKYLAHALDALGDASGRHLRRRAEKLADQLGDEHDLVLLSEALDQTTSALDAAVLAQLHALIDRRRARLRQSAFRLGARAFRRKPRRYARKLRRRLAAESQPPMPARKAR